MQVFKSKIGYELLIPITLIVGAIPIWVIVDGAPVEAIVVVSLIILVTYAFVLYILLGTTYTIIDNRYLTVRSGFTKYKPIAIGTIKAIFKTNNLTSSPAPSFDRIKIYYGNGNSIIISPKDKQKFVSALKNINPGISYQPK
ncbi:MAG: PH domain-containing protein [Tunicatimonas sp.]|uniref:PH domain-containing protein n=1 Tax=Tunicatimonas sp. TaxID=1940096 RepID=UPI003C71EB4C